MSLFRMLFATSSRSNDDQRMMLRMVDIWRETGVVPVAHIVADVTPWEDALLPCRDRRAVS